MNDQQKIELFDRCIPKDLEKYLDTLNKDELNNLMDNLSLKLKKNYFFIKPKIKSMTKKK